MKYGMNSFDISVVISELDSDLLGFRINNIYQINAKTMLLKLRQPENYLYLIIEAGKRIHLTSYSYERPSKPSHFCMALRKHLKNGIITKIEQYEFERIIEIHLRNRGADFRLVLELFANGNIILVDSDETILQALSYRRMKDRDILRNKKFEYPPSSGLNPITLDRETFCNNMSSSNIEVVRAIVRKLSLGGMYAEEILKRAGISKTTISNNLTLDDINRIYDSLKQILSEIRSDQKKPIIFVSGESEWVDVAPLELAIYDYLEKQSFRTFNLALDEYCTRATSEKTSQTLKDKTNNSLESLSRMLNNQEKALTKLLSKIEINKKIGDIIFRHYRDLQFLLNKVMTEKRKGKDWIDITENLEREKKSITTPALYFKKIVPRKISLQVEVESHIVDLDLKISIQENAAEYYKKGKKAQKKISGLEKAIERTRIRIEDFNQSFIEEIDEYQKTRIKRTKRKWYEKFRWVFSSEGYLIIGGKDSSSNEVLIKRHVEPNDLIFHSEITGAAFVLIKTSGKKPSIETMNEAAQMAASYSKAWSKMLGSINVYWVLPKQVSKSPPSGEYLSKGSFMIYGTKNYIRNVQLEIAIGIKKEEDAMKVIGGPTAAIIKQTSLYVKLEPGREKSGKLAKKIKHKLARRASKDEQDAIMRITTDEIQKFIPSGRASIKENISKKSANKYRLPS